MRFYSLALLLAAPTCWGPESPQDSTTYEVYTVDGGTISVVGPVIVVEGPPGGPGPAGPQGDPGPAGACDPATCIWNGDTPQDASFNVVGAGTVGYLSVNGDAVTTGDMGVGTASPNLLGWPGTVLTVQTTASNGRAVLELSGHPSGGNDYCSSISFSSNTAGEARLAQIDVARNFGSSSNANMIFYTRGSDALQDRMRIANGNLGIGPGIDPHNPIELTSGAYVSPAGVWTNASSRTYKREIEPFTGAMSLLERVNVYTYRMRDDHGDDGRVHIGVIAEELPDQLSSADHKGAPTAELIALSLAANRELQQRIAALEEQNRELARRLEQQSKALRELKDSLNAPK